MMFGGLRDALESSDVWTPFEAVVREIAVTLGNGMFRDRFIGTHGSCHAQRARPDAFVQGPSVRLAMGGACFDW